jgi:hypothetical protein
VNVTVFEDETTSVATFTGVQIADLVDTGADKPVKVSLNPAIDGVDTGLDSKGFNILFDYVDATHVNGVTSDGRTVFTLVQDDGVDNVLGTADDAFTFTLLDQVDHVPLATGGGDAETIALSLASVFVATDFDGDSVVIDAGATVTIENDVPSGLTPDALNDVENNGIAGTSDQIPALLNFSVGADEVGSVVFNVPGVPVGVTSGITVAATDLDAKLLTLGGQQLYLYYGGAGGTDTTILVAKTLTGTVGFTIDILTGTYIFNPEGVISNGTEVTATNLTGVGGANVPFKLLINIGGTFQDVAMTTANGATVNSDADDIGISQGQTFETGEVIRFDLVNDLSIDGSGYAYKDHNETVRWKQTIQITGNQSERANIVVSAIVADTDITFFGDADETFIDLSTANIKIYDQNGLIPTASYSALGINLTDQGNSILIEGLRDDWSYEIVTDDSHKFSAVQVEAATGTDNFSLGFFTYGVDSAGTPIALSYDIVGTDADGDSTTGTIDITLNPDAVSAPAGVAGQSINLGLTAPSAEDGALVTVAIADVPAGWTLDGGTLLDDGTWTVQTTDPRSLSITSPADFTGAKLLNVTETWTQADGSTAKITIADNVEVFAPGNPIFAWSGDDHLTGSSGKDQFVFAQPIGHDTIYNFNPGEDQIDLIGYAGFSNFDDVKSHLTADANGNAAVTLANGQTITLNGVAAASLAASNFVFDQMPITNNAGTMTISDGAVLPLSGIINNAGIIALDSIGNDTHLELIQYGITLQGGGQLILSDSGENFISGTIPSVTLTNVDNTISGAGQLGAGQMTLVNDGTIVATGSHALVIDTGANVVTNIGTLEATASGGLLVNSDVANSGLIWAYGGNITINGAVTGSGSAMINGIATLEFGAASSSDVTFAADAAGTLILDHSLTQPFSAVISGLGADDIIDLKDLAFTSGDMTATTSFANGDTTLVVSNASTNQSVTFTLAGDYTHSTWSFAQDSFGTGTIVSDPPATDTGAVALDTTSSSPSNDQLTATTTTDAGLASNLATTSQTVTGATISDGTQAGATIQAVFASTPGTGTNGVDTFVFAPNFGNTTVTNFNADMDVIEIDHAIFADFQALLAAAHDDSHGNAVIAADPHDTITLKDVTVAQLIQHQGDFHFT